MGFARRLVRQTVRAATPRPVRKAMHPVRTAKNAVIPRPVHHARRVLYTATNPLGAAENALIRGALRAPGQVVRAGTRTRSTRRTASRAVTTGSGAWILDDYASSPTLAQQATASHDVLGALMAVQRAKFAPAVRPQIPVVGAVSVGPIQDRLWSQRKGEAHWWQRSKRAALLTMVVADARREAEQQWAQAEARRIAMQSEADRWWDGLNSGDVAVCEPALVAAFSDNAAPVVIDMLGASETRLRVALPGLDVMPNKVAHVTPSGRWSARAWKKTELNDAYRAILGAHVLATLREAWAVAPALQRIQLVGQRKSDGDAGYLFLLDVRRDYSQWTDDEEGLRLLDLEPMPLRLSARSREIELWPFERASGGQPVQGL